MSVTEPLVSVPVPPKDEEKVSNKTWRNIGNIVVLAIAILLVVLVLISFLVDSKNHYSIPSDHVLYPFFRPSDGQVIVPDNNLNNISRLELNGLSGVTKLTIGSGSGKKVIAFDIINCPNLLEISIHENSFTECSFEKDDTPADKKPSQRIQKEKRSFSLYSLGKLKRIDIHYRSFADFMTFNISKCDSLEFLSLGPQQIKNNTVQYSDSYNFFWATELVLMDLPALSEWVPLAHLAFKQTPLVYISNLPSLKSIEFSSWSTLYNANNFTMRNMPKLQVFNVASMDSMYMTTIFTLADCPELTSLLFGAFNGLRSVQQLLLTKLPKLDTLKLNGVSAFKNTKVIRIEDLPLLQSLEMSEIDIMQYSHNVTIKNLPLLKTINVTGTDALQSIYNVWLIDLPALEMIELSGVYAIRGRSDKDKPGMISIQNAPNVKDITFGKRVGADAPLHYYQKIQKNKSVSEVLLSKLVSHLKTHSFYNATVIVEDI